MAGETKQIKIPYNLIGVDPNGKKIAKTIMEETANGWELISRVEKEPSSLFPRGTGHTVLIFQKRD